MFFSRGLSVRTGDPGDPALLIPLTALVTSTGAGVLIGSHPTSSLTQQSCQITSCLLKSNAVLTKVVALTSVGTRSS
jgi:hypothetical protein